MITEKIHYIGTFKNGSGTIKTRRTATLTGKSIRELADYLNEKARVARSNGDELQAALFERNARIVLRRRRITVPLPEDPLPLQSSD